MGDVVFFVEDLESNLEISYCRICQEEEIEGCKKLEAPCACSGTVKYAHRDCIQRWCDEKGNTTCEICLQKYEPGYTAAPKNSQQIDDAFVTVRDSLEIPRPEHEPLNPRLGNTPEEVTVETEYSECTSSADRASRWRSLFIIFTVLLLVPHFFGMAAGSEKEDYPFTVATVVMLKASGILLPMYIFIQIIGAIQNMTGGQHHDSDDYEDTSNIHEDEEDEQQDDLV